MSMLRPWRGFETFHTGIAPPPDTPKQTEPAPTPPRQSTTRTHTPATSAKRATTAASANQQRSGRVLDRRRNGQTKWMDGCCVAPTQQKRALTCTLVGRQARASHGYLVGIATARDLALCVGICNSAPRPPPSFGQHPTSFGQHPHQCCLATCWPKHHVFCSRSNSPAAFIGNLFDRRSLSTPPLSASSHPALAHFCVAWRSSLGARSCGKTPQRPSRRGTRRLSSVRRRTAEQLIPRSARPASSA